MHMYINTYIYIYIYTHMRILAQEAATSGTDKQLPPAEYCGAQLPIHARSRDTRLQRQRPHLHTWLCILYILWLLLACLCILFLWFLYRPYGHDHKRLNNNARRVVAPCRFWSHDFDQLKLEMKVEIKKKFARCSSLNTHVGGQQVATIWCFFLLKPIV